VAHEFVDNDDVMTLADECGSEGVAQDVAGELICDVGFVGDRAQDVVCAASAETGPALVEQWRVGLVGTFPRWPLVADPQIEVGAQLWVDGDLAVLAALAGTQSRAITISASLRPVAAEAEFGITRRTLHT
jgi:hypothetical protein